MGTTFKQKGKSVTYYNAGAAIAVDAVVAMANRIGIAMTSIASLASGELSISGVHELTAKSTDTGSIGDVMYWDAGNSRLTTTAGGNTLAGLLHKAKTNGQTTAEILLTPFLIAAPADTAVTRAKLATALAAVIVDPDAIADPGAGAAIPVTASGTVELITAAGLAAPEAARTLADPATKNLLLIISARSLGTVGANGYATVNAASAFSGVYNTLTFQNDGDLIALFSVQAGASLVWRQLAIVGAVPSTR